MLRRAALVAVTLVPITPALAWAQATPDRAASLQQQIQDWLQSTIGSGMTIARSPVQVTAAGDHYDLAAPLGVAPDAPIMSGKMTDAGSGRWAIDDVRIPSPSVFHVHLPPSTKPGAPIGEISSTLTIGEQNQRILFDPTFATASTWTSAIKDLAATTTGPMLTQLSHIDSAIGASTMTPSSDGRVDIAVNSAVEGYSLKMSGAQNAQPVSVAMGKVSLVANVLRASRERSLDLIRMTAKITAAPGTPQTAPPDRDTSTAMLAALADLAAGIAFEETANNVSLTVQGLSGSLDLFSVGLAAKADAGKLQAQMPVAAQGLTLPELGLGSMATLIPTKLSFTPNLAGVPTGALMQVAQKFADKQEPDDADVAGLFGQGPVTAGIDTFLMDVAGSHFAGSFKVSASAPTVFSGAGQITADNFEGLQQALSSDPQTAQVAPLMIFLKGIGRIEQNRLIWDIAYRGGRLLVNGQDMTALAGAGSASPGDAPAARPHPPQQNAAPARRSPPNRQP